VAQTRGILTPPLESFGYSGTSKASRPTCARNKVVLIGLIKKNLQIKIFSSFVMDFFYNFLDHAVIVCVQAWLENKFPMYVFSTLDNKDVLNVLCPMSCV
jgi:hypothetical protein